MSKQQIKQKIEELRNTIRHPSNRVLFKLYGGPIWTRPIMWLIKRLRRNK